MHDAWNYSIKELGVTHGPEACDMTEILSQTKWSSLQKMIATNYRNFAVAIKERIPESLRLELKWTPENNAATIIFENQLRTMLLCIQRVLDRSQATYNAIINIFSLSYATKSKKVNSNVILLTMLDMHFPDIAPSGRYAYTNLLYYGKKPEATSELFAAPVA